HLEVEQHVGKLRPRWVWMMRSATPRPTKGGPFRRAVHHPRPPRWPGGKAKLDHPPRKIRNPRIRFSRARAELSPRLPAQHDVKEHVETLDAVHFSPPSLRRLLRHPDPPFLLMNISIQIIRAGP